MSFDQMKSNFSLWLLFYYGRQVPQIFSGAVCSDLEGLSEETHELAKENRYRVSQECMDHYCYWKKLNSYGAVLRLAHLHLLVPCIEVILKSEMQFRVTHTD